MPAYTHARSNFTSLLWCGKILPKLSPRHLTPRTPTGPQIAEWMPKGSVTRRQRDENVVGMFGGWRRMYEGCTKVHVACGHCHTSGKAVGPVRRNFGVHEACSDVKYADWEKKHSRKDGYLDKKYDAECRRVCSFRCP